MVNKTSMEEDKATRPSGKVDVQQIKRKHQIDEAAQAREIEERKRIKRQKREERNRLRAEGKPTKKKHLVQVTDNGDDSTFSAVPDPAAETLAAVKPMTATSVPRRSDRKKKADTTKKEEKNACELALNYLNEWRDSRDTWKFQKVRQTYLLHHMYDPYKISKEDFKVLLNYVNTLRGHSRTATAKEAEVLLKKLENESAEAGDKEDEESVIALKKIKTHRAKKVSQILADVK